MGTRDELLMAVAARYSAAKRSEKSRILTEFAEISGYHRKHAERLLRREHAVDRSQPRPGRRVYDEAVREALVVLWEAGDRICGKRLKPLILGVNLDVDLSKSRQHIGPASLIRHEIMPFITHLFRRHVFISTGILLSC